MMSMNNSVAFAPTTTDPNKTIVPNATVEGNGNTLGRYYRRRKNTRTRPITENGGLTLERIDFSGLVENSGKWLRLLKFRGWI